MAKLKAPFALDRSLNTTEQTSRNIADVLAEELSAIITALGGLNFINYEVVEELPTTGISTTTIYLVPSDDPQSGNTYDEYINLNGTSAGWEKIGSTAIDLSGYYTSAETDALLDEKVDKDSFDEQTATDEFSTINGGLLSECKVALSPNQDLHGYPEPWVGGAGKNKLPLVLADIKSANTSGTWSGNVYSVNGGTIEVLVDDSDNVIGFKVNGTFTNATGFILYTKTGTPYPFNNTNYIINGCPSGGGASTYKVDGVYKVGGVDTVLTTDYGIGDTADYSSLSSATIVHFRIVIYSGTVDNKIFYPMIRLATETDPTFEPYSNICPISGHTQAKVVNDGKNLISGIENGAVNDYGSPSTSAYRCRTVDFIHIEPNTQYTLKALSDDGTLEYLVRTFEDADGSYRISDSGWYQGAFTFTSQANAHDLKVIFRFSNNASIDASQIYNVQLELGSTATPYVPYNGYQVTVNLGGTYYSGTLDVVTGVFTPDTAEVVYDGSNDEGWNSDRPNYRVFISAPDIKSDTTNIISSAFRRVLPSETYQGVSGIACSSTLLFVGTLGMSVADWRTFLSNNPLQVNYELATPTPIQLSPTMVKALVGENHLSAPLDGQEITEVKYKKMFTFDDVIAYIQSLS